MKISIDDKELFTLTDIQKTVIKNDIPDEVFDEDIKRRLEYVLMHKYEQCFERLKKEWEPKLSERVPSVPTSKDELAKLIFSQPDYKNRSEREKI